MKETSARLLRLLSLLQTRRDWSGAELADRLGVTTRTIRRDVERLRELGYPVHATRGTAGYRLGAGASLPPLLLDDDEAVAVTVGLRTAAGGSVAGIEETSLRALAKIEQVLPSRLRHRVNTLHTATVRVGGAGPAVSPDTLMAIADACRRRERLRLDYTSPRGGGTVRSVEPHSLVSFDRHWYLVAWDVDRDDWRTFRVDRLTPRPPAGPRFAPRRPPDGDVATYLAHRLSTRAWPVQATVTLHEPAQAVADRIWPGTGVVEAVDDRNCLLHVGAETPSALVWMITSVDADFTLTSGPPALADAFRAQAARCLHAVRATPSS
ncbi:putative DNA-binding transcriptional regulator YafY [Streptosporangium becharense]|uniref:Putative DNA-binding transcriptional regulator YafY n=1 Tax=Streptosporangium becharense TaxID=1816182 RepID=A0A7W9IAU0_9ACTN|nr:YafY family protein [Streptosporangium becharense]MBB2915341.1 putative DNA-binding transcriptional regulator YafY [Streptosporangium becharense]MBB5816961.1 putative DNA-binding transcriptional regulator YafY [Streptosporangium becharense]